MHTTATDAHGTAENSYMVSAILHNCPLWCVSHILFPSGISPNLGTTASSCITSSLVMQSVSSTQAFFHVFKWWSPNERYFDWVPDNLNYTKTTIYRHILYQAAAKLSETIDIDQLVVDNEITVALADKKHGVCPNWSSLCKKWWWVSSHFTTICSVDCPSGWNWEKFIHSICFT